MTDRSLSFSLEFPRAHGTPLSGGKIRVEPEDFRVDEILGFQASGSGEHHLVQLQKKGCNTEWLARQIAKFCQVQPMDVGYCGLKDRRAVTSQWFSVYAPKAAAFDWRGLVSQIPDPVAVLASGRHNKKLKRGGHAGNRFALQVREFAAPVDPVETRMRLVVARGVPNYFGVQRFGSNGNNLHAAHAWANNARLARQQKSFAMSAARAYLFNLVLAKRVTDANWTAPIEGDALMSDTPTGPLWGRGRSSATGEAGASEDQALAEFAGWKDALEHCGLMQARRSLVCRPQDFSYRLEATALHLEFTLAAGEFATSVLRELVDVESVE